MTIETEARTEHLDAATTASYLDGRLEARETERVRSHLADCDECRAEVVEVAGAAERITSTKRRRLYVPAAAAAVAALVLIGGPLTRDADRGDVLRAPDRIGTQGAADAIAAVTPSAGATVDPSGLVLTWRAVGPQTMYRVTVTDSGGDPLWSRETRDTAVLLPAQVVLERGAPYRWYVDALFPDGRTATTGVQSFRTAR